MDALTPQQILARIRYDTDSQRGSVLDVVQLVTGCGQTHTTETLKSITDKFSDVQRMEEFKFPGRGQRPTPVAPLPVLVKIIMLCPGKTARKWRMHAAEVLCRALGGEQSLCAEIEAQKDAVVGSLLENLRECPDPEGWKPLQQLDFGLEEDDSTPEGLVYLAGAPEFALVKVGSWGGDEASLLSRYRTYYGPHAWVQAWQSQDRRRDEAAALFALKEHSAGGELIVSGAADEAARLIHANLPPAAS